MATYSNKTKAVSATHNATGAPGNTQTLTLPDTHTAQGARISAMQNGTSINCQLPDGQIGQFIFDAELSTPNNPILRRVA